MRLSKSAVSVMLMTACGWLILVTVGQRVIHYITLEQLLLVGLSATGSVFIVYKIRQDP